jgi:hypothetical protein
MDYRFFDSRTINIEIISNWIVFFVVDSVHKEGDS